MRKSSSQLSQSRRTRTSTLVGPRSKALVDRPTFATVRLNERTADMGGVRRPAGSERCGANRARPAAEVVERGDGDRHVERSVWVVTARGDEADALV